MDDKNTFFGKLHNEFQDLERQIQSKKYIVLEPRKKLIDATDLTKNFYYNHIFYKCKYDDHLIINLNGKVLKYEHPKLTSFLGWNKEMVLTVKDQSVTTTGYEVLQLDNVCDELRYTESKSTFSKENQLKECKNRQEYLEYYKDYPLTNEAFKKNLQRLNKFTKEMKTNYILMKGFEENYKDIFNERINKLINKFNEILRNPKDDTNISYKVSSELTESLVFNELYDYIFNCLKEFNKNDEKKLKDYLKDAPPKYEWDGLKVEPIYRQCKFLGAIDCLDNISKYKTIFEKIEALSNVNLLITEEAKNIYESESKGNKGNFTAQGDILLTFWIYVIAHCKTENIIAESRFLNYFLYRGYNDQNYVATTFFSAVETITNELLTSDKLVLSQYVEFNKVNVVGK